MTVQPPTASLPELGPLLGRLVAPPADKAPFEAALEGVRLELLSELFERGAAARRLLSAGDEAGMRAALGPGVWLELWERAVQRATVALLAEIDQQIRDAGQLSRYPMKRLSAQLPDAEERRLLAARLSASGLALEDAVERLASGPVWNESLHRAAGELEVAWERLRTTALAELDLWSRRAAELRSWHRPWRPLVLAGSLLFALALWLGLVLGGYLQVPPWLRPFAEWVWSL